MQKERNPAVEILRMHYIERKRKNPAYSVRAFAKSLKFSSGALSQILSEKRPLTARQAEKLSQTLFANPEQQQKFVWLAMKKEVASDQEWQAVGDVQFGSLKLVELDHFHLISDWYHYALLSLMETKQFRSDIRWISKRLGINLWETRQALERLLRMKLIERVAGGYRLSFNGVATPPDVPSSAVREMHRQIIQKALAALDDIPLDERDITSMTMAIDKRRLKAAKLKIQKFRRALSAFLEQGERDEVYNLSIQLVPVTR